MTAADRAPVNYGYDSGGRLNTITQSGQTFTFNYDILSRRSTLQRPNGVTTSYSYDQVDRLTRLMHVNGAGTLEDFQYEYNSDDEITKITSLASATLATQSKTVSAADAANRIAQIGPASFSFDQEGQITSKTDANGITSYQWDARGRLKQVALPNGQTVGYGYDALGRRSSRTANGVTTNFLYDGADVAVDRENGVSKVEYLNGAGVDEKLRQTDIGIASYYFLQDHLGSTSALTNSSGGLIGQPFQYEAFGASTSSSLTRYGYTGRELDSLTGLMHYRARWYDPQQGRFLSEDPIGFEGGLNLYGYVGNSPLMYADPSGQIAFLPILAAAGASFIAGFIISTALGQCYGWKDVLTDWAIDAATFGAFKGVKWLAKAMGRSLKVKNLLKAMGPQVLKGVERIGGKFGARSGLGLDNIGKGGNDIASSGSRKPMTDWGGGRGGGPQHGGSGGGAGSGGSAGGTGNDLLDALSQAQQVGDRLEATLDDGAKLIFRQDIGAKAHPIGSKYPQPVDHYNVEIHKPVPGRPGRFKQVGDLHLILDVAGNVIDIIFIF